MITVQKAKQKHIHGIARICIAGYRATYGDLLSTAYIERLIKEFYNPNRLLDEVTKTSRSWIGWIVAVEDDEVVGAGVGGMISKDHGELFVLYTDPERRKKGIGTMILDTVTDELIKYGAKEQWVNVTKGNQKGIPFYEAKGFQFVHEQDEYGILPGEDFKALRYHRFL
ncbi:GNAT family N-acetyltransferase [Bacillus sp. FJAT-50079]|uniref:GNAT family N-acetyltransferase n=1 Tax=Bacillus sp. FJAT-50079 TaxID=2833577 RepID=UPI001BC90232|nr:GNAT family N-acetyltransferase [Bacillus sp. FJAT-50079]MBS4209492.1 GNAT family N-acetyltransferase [Bacillus sp. FJAT-50079]